MSTLPEEQIQLLTNGITEDVVRPVASCTHPPAAPALLSPSLPPTPPAYRLTASGGRLPPDPARLPPAYRLTADAARVHRWVRCVCWSTTS